MLIKILILKSLPVKRMMTKVVSTSPLWIMIIKGIFLMVYLTKIINLYK